MRPRPLLLLLIAGLGPLACAWGRSRPRPPAPPISDPFTAPVSSAVIQKARSCQKVEDCGAPPADGTTWQCRLGSCTPAANVPEEPAAASNERQAAVTPAEPPLPDAEPPAKGDPGDRSTVPPGLFAPSPVPAPITPPAVEAPPPAPPTDPPPPAPTPAPPAPTPPAAPAPAPQG